MKYVQTHQIVNIPEDVTIQIKSRLISVTGPRGELHKNLRHIDVTFAKLNRKAIQITVHNGDRKHVAALRTVKSLVDNMVTGVTIGFKYKMRYVYAHFPINVNIVDSKVSTSGKTIEVRNYLGEKTTRVIDIPKGVTAEISKSQKDEISLFGNSLEDVSQTCASVQQSCKARNKDIRKFLDGIYVSERGHEVEEV